MEKVYTSYNALTAANPENVDENVPKVVDIYDQLMRGAYIYY